MRSKSWNVGSKAALIAFAVVFLAPVYFMIIGGLQDIHGVMLMPPRLLPYNPTLDNYAWVLRLNGAGRWALNTVIVTALGTALSVTVCTMAAYAFAFYRFPGKRALWLLLMSRLMIPRISVIIPLFVVMRHIGMNGTLLAVILPAAVWPIGMYLARTYFESVPLSLLESARIDGAHEWQILLHVVAPVSRPIVTALALFTAVGQMGDFLWQMLQLTRVGRQTLLVGLTRAVMRFGAVGTELAVNPLGRSMAVGTVLLAPLLIIFFTASRYFTSALGGALKE